MKGVVVDVRATVAGERLRVGARVSTGDGMIDALLPDREVAAFLPRSLLLAGKGKRAAQPAREPHAHPPPLRRGQGCPGVEL